MFGKEHGGIGNYVAELASRLPKIDSDNDYVFFHGHGAVWPKDFVLPANVKLVLARQRHYSFGEQLSFLRTLNNENLDLVHFPNFNLPIFYKRPFVVTIHDVVHHKISGAKKSRLPHFWAYKKVIAAAAKKSQKIITVSKSSKNDILKYLNVPDSKVAVIYEAGRLEKHVPEAKVDEVRQKFLIKRPYFLFVGVLERKKNLINLTRGFDAMVKKYRLDMDLVIAGRADKHYPDIRHKAMDISFHNRLVFTDQVEDADLAALYKDAVAYVSASLHEGFGLPGVEAMKFNLPLAVSNIDVFNEIYDNAAIYFNPLDPDDIAEKMFLLAKDEQFHMQMQEKSYHRGQMFSWDETAGQTLEIYRRVLKI